MMQTETQSVSQSADKHFSPDKLLQPLSFKYTDAVQSACIISSQARLCHNE